MNKRIRDRFENGFFGVCTFLGDKLGVSRVSVRLFFIYSSFLTFGSPVIIYLITAFWVDIRRYLKKSRHTVWDV